ncbi:hypothetical protein NG799_01970 [Laspinema sp. D1]|uniref:Uncharacterized protein n=1 Tax=Laspinema palackyanum D2a TaxID=2953684 RepID=A0ABT2MK39_9CYAN|nr:hypothetical protein [Laspinema sp. D2a]
MQFNDAKIDTKASSIYFVYPFTFDIATFDSLNQAIPEAKLSQKQTTVWETQPFPTEDLLFHVANYLKPTESQISTAQRWTLSGAVRDVFGFQDQWELELTSPQGSVPFAFGKDGKAGDVVQLVLFRVGVGFLILQVQPKGNTLEHWLNFLHYFRFLKGQQGSKVKVQKRQWDAQNREAFWEDYFPEIAQCPPQNKPKFGQIVKALLHTVSSEPWWSEIFVPGQMLPFVSLYVDNLPEAKTPHLLYKLQNFFHEKQGNDPSPEDLDPQIQPWLPYARGQWFVCTLEGSSFLAVNASTEQFFRETLPYHLRQQYFLLFLLALHQRFALMSLSGQVAESWVKDEATRLQQFEKIRDRLLLFTARGYFAQVMQREHHHRCYCKWQEVFQLDRLYREVHDEVREMQEYSTLQYLRRLEAAEKQRDRLRQEERERLAEVEKKREQERLEEKERQEKAEKKREQERLEEKERQEKAEKKREQERLEEKERLAEVEKKRDRLQLEERERLAAAEKKRHQERREEKERQEERERERDRFYMLALREKEEAGKQRERRYLQQLRAKEEDQAKRDREFQDLAYIISIGLGGAAIFASSAGLLTAGSDEGRVTVEWIPSFMTTWHPVNVAISVSFCGALCFLGFVELLQCTQRCRLHRRARRKLEAFLMVLQQDLEWFSWCDRERLGELVDSRPDKPRELSKAIADWCEHEGHPQILGKLASLEQRVKPDFRAKKHYKARLRAAISPPTAAQKKIEGFLQLLQKQSDLFDREARHHLAQQQWASEPDKLAEQISKWCQGERRSAIYAQLLDEQNNLPSLLLISRLEPYAKRLQKAIGRLQPRKPPSLFSRVVNETWRDIERGWQRIKRSPPP